MKKIAIGSGLILVLGLGFLGGAPAEAAPKIRLYLGLEGSYTFVTMESGGFNSVGDFRNQGQDGGTILGPSVHIGLEWDRMIRLDLSYRERGGLQFTTSGYSWEYPYRSTVDAATVMASLSVKILPKGAVSPYLGAGLGGTSMEGTATDLVVQGSAGGKSLTWQVEVGVQFDPLSLFSFRLGYRYVALGKIDMPLYESGLEAGNFTAALKAGEIVIEARIRI